VGRHGDAHGDYATATIFGKDETGGGLLFDG